MAESQPDQDAPDYHPEAFNWRGLIFIIIGAALLVVAVIAVVYLFGSPPTSPTSTTSFHSTNPCGICH